MLRRRRIAKAKAIVGQLLGEAHGFTDAEVEEFTLQYMNLSEQLVFKPGDDQQAKIATQTLLHMDCNVMSDQQVTNLLRASQHPWLTEAKFVKQRKELTQEVIPKYDCKEDLVELKQYAGEMLKTFESWEKDSWTSSATGIKYDVQLYVTDYMKWLRTVCGQKSAAPGRWQRIQSFWKAWWQQFRKINTPTPFEPAAALLWQSQTRKVFRDATSPVVQPEHPKIVSGEWKVEMEGDPYSFICWAHRPQDEDGRHPAVTRPDGSILRAKTLRPRVSDFLMLSGNIYYFSCQSLELMNNMHGDIFFKRCARRPLTYLRELIEADYRVRELQLRGFMLKEYKYRCTLCTRRFVYQKCFKTHMADCRQDEPDISDVTNVDKSHFWEQCDFVAANEEDE
eukprot:g82690.t1